MKILKSRATEWGNTEIVAIDTLYPYVDIDYYINELPHKKEYNINYQAVLKSIEAEGMKNPIVVAPVSREEWAQMTHPIPEPDILPYPDVSSEVVPQVRCGCKRLHMAKYGGFTHIECVVLDNYKQSSNLCIGMRNDWKRNKDSFRS